MKAGDQVNLELENQLAEATNLHVHGLHVSPQGNSDNALVSIAPGESFDYEYRLTGNHPPGVYWYHPHLHGSVADHIHACNWPCRASPICKKFCQRTEVSGFRKLIFRKPLFWLSDFRHGVIKCVRPMANLTLAGFILYDRPPLYPRPRAAANSVLVLSEISTR